MISVSVTPVFSVKCHREKVFKYTSHSLFVFAVVLTLYVTVISNLFSIIFAQLYVVVHIYLGFFFVFFFLLHCNFVSLCRSLLFL